MTALRVVAVGASAGGLEALKQLFGGIPGDFPAALLVVLHVPPDSPSILPTILGRSAVMPVDHAHDGEPLVERRAYVAPPDHHLLVREGGRLVLSRGPRENRHRPAVDPLFRSAARVYGPRAVGVVLSGNLDDGASGIEAIRRGGGLALVQSPDDAAQSGMPCAAIEALAPDGPDHVVRAAELGPLLDRLVRAPGRAPEKGGVTAVSNEDKIADFDVSATHGTQETGSPSAYICPDCGGTLFELRDGKLARYRCRVGHAYSLDSLTEAKTENLEDTLWSALRSMEEHAAVSRQSAARARARKLGALAEQFERRAREDEAHASALRAIVQTTERKP